MHCVALQCVASHCVALHCVAAFFSCECSKHWSSFRRFMVWISPQPDNFSCFFAPIHLLAVELLAKLDHDGNQSCSRDQLCLQNTKWNCNLLTTLRFACAHLKVFPVAFKGPNKDRKKKQEGEWSLSNPCQDCLDSVGSVSIFQGLTRARGGHNRA